MKALYARELTDEERDILHQSLKSRDGFRVRRAQMILMSADEQLKVNEIGRLNQDVVMLCDTRNPVFEEPGFYAISPPP